VKGAVVLARTKPQAHFYIEQHWAELKDCDDVQFILKETDTAKVSQRFGSPLEP
jgi:hypothetical protein